MVCQSLTLDAESTEILDDIINSACVAFMAAQGIAAKRTPQAETELRELAAVIGFAGAQLRGSLVITYDNALAAATCTDCGGTVNILDWTGEVANQLLGRIKNKLLAHGVSIDLCTPVALSGKKLESTIGESVAVRSFTFNTMHGACTVYFDYRLVEQLELRTGFQSDSAIRQEGELVLF